MIINTTEEYESYEKRLIIIKNSLEEMAEKDQIELSTVIKLRNEAREIAQALKDFLKTTFENKNE